MIHFPGAGDTIPFMLLVCAIPLVGKNNMQSVTLHPQWQDRLQPATEDECKQSKL